MVAGVSPKSSSLPSTTPSVQFQVHPSQHHSRQLRRPVAQRDCYKNMTICLSTVDHIKSPPFSVGFCFLSHRELSVFHPLILNRNPKSPLGMRAAMFGVFGKGKRGVKKPEPFGSTVGRREFSYSELIQITSDFKNNIHRGGFGPCFHGYVDGLQVFVMLYSSKDKSHFQKEVEVLQRIHHRNLINIVGYCKEDKHLALVLGYMTNGDLGKHLSEKSSSVLTWEARLRIAVQVAQGLEYLHNFCEPPIVHRNLKMDTILLNGNFEAKLGGFSLARPMKSDDSSHETTVVCGTFGYIDPEYCSTGRLTVKSDVYSFGVVLLMIITGRPACSRDQEYKQLSQWVKSTLEHGDVSDVIDPRMNGEYEIEFVEKALKLAMACVSDTSNARPSMNEVVSGLKKCRAC